jgi:hypothetical protein
MKVEKVPITSETALLQSIRIDKKGIVVKIVMISGKEGNHYVTLAPSINVSGYGRNIKDADESFDENMDLFLEDLMKLSKEQRELEILKLGFKKERFKNKNFSKAYVDENGVLNNFEKGTLKKAVLETSFA